MEHHVRVFKQMTKRKDKLNKDTSCQTIIYMRKRIWRKIDHSNQKPLNELVLTPNEKYKSLGFTFLNGVGCF